MLSDSQSPAHRAQPPTRSKNRWQPYPYQSLGPVPSTSDLNTPKPSVSPTPIPPVTPNNNNHPPIQREVGKQKYALGLIDQAVKTLSEIWRPEDIPCAFVGPAKGATSPGSSSSSTILSPQSSFVSAVAETDNALPMKNFVHEVLKRSRTSGSVMQTALCYLEAIRLKVPQILCDEKSGIRSYFMPESAILPATEAELQMDRRLSNLEESEPSTKLTKTERLTDEDVDCETSTMPPGGMIMHTVSASPLPSPLLCPRRTFLAALILASKFSQDKCYSNRAWAKLSGLPPREIGRCERALGQALDWRLWVGKKALMSSDVVASSVVTPSPTGPTRAVARTQSESCINVTSSSREPFICPSEPKRPDPQTCPNSEASTMGAWTGKGLRRCVTLPTESCTGSKMPSTSLVKNLENSRDMRWTQVPYSSSDRISSGTSSPETPPLSYSPSTSGERTIQTSTYEDDMFPSSSQSKLDLEDYTSSIYSASPSSFTDSADAKLYCSRTLNIPFAEGKLTAMRLQMTLAETVSESLWSSRLAVVAGPHLWHADGGHISLESAPVH